MEDKRRGEIWAGLAALSFVGFELAQRYAAPSVGPMTGALVRTLPLVAASWGYLALNPRRRGRPDLGWEVFLALVLIGSFDFVIGNSLKLLAFRTGGISVSLPLLEAGNLVGAAALAVLVVHQPLRLRLGIGVGVMVLGAVALSVGTPALPHWGIAVPSALGAGLAFAAALALTAYVLSRGVGLASILAVSSTTGLAILAVIILAGGAPALTGISAPDFASLLASGVLNGLALFCLSRAVLLIDVARANAIAATNSAIAAAVGALVFGENPGLWGWIGIGTVFIGAFIARLSASGGAGAEPEGDARTGEA